MNLIARIAIRLGRFSERFVPSAFSIAVLLTLATAGLALVAAGALLETVLRSWGDGFWSLLAFGMRMALVMFTGYMLAVSPLISRALERLAALPRSPRSAVVFMALVSMGLALLNWGLSIVGSAVMVRFLAKRKFGPTEIQADYRLLVASAYFGLGATWHAGLSASAPLIAATAAEPITQKFGLVTIDQTIFSVFNIALVVATLILLGVLAWFLHPREEETFAVDSSRVDLLKSFTPPQRPRTMTPAAWLDHTPMLNLIVGCAGLLYVALRLHENGWRKIDIDLVNFIFFSLAVLFHRTPASVLAAAEEAASVLSGIVFQFPLYAGIYGIFQGTGLTDIVGDFFVRHASASTFPAVIYWYSGIINYFVPSGGAKWTIEAPYILAAAKTMGVDNAKIVLAYAWGDMATDLIQPFWALPLLAVAKLDFKDILGYLLIACAAYMVLVSAAFLVFL